MAKLTKTTLFKASTSRSETLLDKTTRAVKLILDEETELRKTKTERLRKARLELESDTPEKATKKDLKGSRTKSMLKASN
ncbi:MAG: hypothetical protein HKN18_08910 [Silicimonas sp.]|nr:hypothetical protein [Silicimonas sp.]